MPIQLMMQPEVHWRMILHYVDMIIIQIAHLKVDIPEDIEVMTIQISLADQSLFTLQSL